MYKYYKVYTGLHTRGRVSMDTVMDDINNNDEEIISVTGIGENNLYLVIVTKTTTRRDM